MSYHAVVHRTSRVCAEVTGTASGCVSSGYLRVSKA